MKISFLVVKGLPGKGGIEKYTHQLGRRLADRGHDVSVYCTSGPECPKGPFDGMEIIPVPAIRKRSLEKMSAVWAAALHLAWRTGSDIAHVHAFGPGMASCLPRLRGMKTVVQGHGIEWLRSRWGHFGRFFLKATEWPSVRFPHRVTVVSKTQREYLKKRYGLDAEYIPVGVGDPKLRPPRLIKEKFGLENKGYLLFAARLVREKGAHFLIQAFRKLDTDLKLVIAGDSPYEQEYKDELKQMAAGDPRIVFTGFVTGELLEELFSNAYIFLQPSTIEGLPIGMLEAMSYGLCCVSSDIPENQEGIAGQGHVFENESPNDLHRVLKDLLQKPEEIKALGEAASQRVLGEHHWDQITSRFESFYRSLMETPRSQEAIA